MSKRANAISRSGLGAIHCGVVERVSYYRPKRHQMYVQFRVAHVDRLYTVTAWQGWRLTYQFMAVLNNLHTHLLRYAHLRRSL